MAEDFSDLEIDAFLDSLCAVLKEAYIFFDGVRFYPTRKMISSSSALWLLGPPISLRII